MEDNNKSLYQRKTEEIERDKQNQAGGGYCKQCGKFAPSDLDNEGLCLDCRQQECQMCGNKFQPEELNEQGICQSCIAKSNKPQEKQSESDKQKQNEAEKAADKTIDDIALEAAGGDEELAQYYKDIADPEAMKQQRDDLIEGYQDDAYNEHLKDKDHAKDMLDQSDEFGGYDDDYKQHLIDSANPDALKQQRADDEELAADSAYDDYMRQKGNDRSGTIDYEDEVAQNPGTDRAKELDNQEYQNNAFGGAEEYGGNNDYKMGGEQSDDFPQQNQRGNPKGANPQGGANSNPLNQLAAQSDENKQNKQQGQNKNKQGDDNDSTEGDPPVTMRELESLWRKAWRIEAIKKPICIPANSAVREGIGGLSMGFAYALAVYPKYLTNTIEALFDILGFIEDPLGMLAISMSSGVAMPFTYAALSMFQPVDKLYAIVDKVISFGPIQVLLKKVRKAVNAIAKASGKGGTDQNPAAAPA